MEKVLLGVNDAEPFTGGKKEKKGFSLLVLVAYESKLMAIHVARMDRRRLEDPLISVGGSIQPGLKRSSKIFGIIIEKKPKKISDFFEFLYF
jgi:hypothetical protein